MQKPRRAPLGDTDDRKIYYGVCNLLVRLCDAAVSNGNAPP